jgi:hypothetical protein
MSFLKSFFKESDSTNISKIIKLLEETNRSKNRSEIICRLSKLPETSFSQKDTKPEILFNAIATGDDGNYYDIMIIKIIIKKLKTYLFMYRDQYEMFATQTAIERDKNNFANIIFDTEIYDGKQFIFAELRTNMEYLQKLSDVLKSKNNEENQRITDIIEVNTQGKNPNARGDHDDSELGGAKQKSKKRSKKRRKTKRRRHTRRQS